MTEPSRSDEPERVARIRFWQNLAILAVVAAGSAVLVWTALGRWQLPRLGPKQYDYYNLLVSGFRKGSLALDIEVPQALKDAKDPIALFKALPDIAPHDLSLYKGHYYTYYGVVPVVVLFWPFRAVAGCDLPLVLGALVFCLGAFWLTAWLWVRLVRDLFPNSGVVTLAGGLAVVGLAAGQWVLVRRISIWEPSLIAGHFFLIAMLAASFQALKGRNLPVWLGLAGVSLGLAAGSRPTLVVAGLGLVPLVVAVAAATPKLGRWRRIFNAALWVGIPLAAVGALLLYYNWARFGNPLELGLNHQLSSWNEAKKSHFRPAFMGFNFYLYFLVSPQWGRYFPFVHPIAMPHLPSGYYGYEYVYGALLLCPALWWGIFTWRIVLVPRGPLFWFAAILLGVALATTPVILSFDTSAARYACDFIPWWTWLAVLGWCVVEGPPASLKKMRRTWLRATFAATALVSCATAFFCSADLHGILERENPEAFAQIGRIFNQPTALWERISGFKSGTVAMDLVFAPKPIESVEPLVVTGVEYQRDYVYVYYQSAHVVRLGYLHPGEAPAESADINVIPGKVYHVEISCGSLFPPEGHPAFKGMQATEIAAFKRWARIIFDGRVVVSDGRGQNEASPGTVQIGHDDGIGYCGRSFAGSITNIRRLGWTKPADETDLGGDLFVKLELQKAPSATILPIFEFGKPGSADIAGIRRLDGKTEELVYESFGTGLWRSAPLSVPEDGEQDLRIRLGSSLPIAADSALSIISKSVVFWRDGKPVWWHRSTAAVKAGGQSSFLRNEVQSTAMAKAFEGRLVAMHCIPVISQWKPVATGHLLLVLGGRGNGVEPIVTTGRTGKADVLGIEWLPNDQARLVYDHWGEPLRASRPFHWDSNSSQTLRISMPSLSCLGYSIAPLGGSVEVELEGRQVWNTPVPYFLAARDQVAVGRNPVGSSATVAELGAAVLDVVQEP
ncbi:MAG TPA: hypothetical protein VFE25_15870 [Opitutaceae bacterium]|nr:hypothetical protein [Opitutaceae bacterium]